MFDFGCTIEEILLPKKTRNDYHVIPIIVEFTYKGKPQLRYMQCVTTQAKNDLIGLKSGDKVTIKVALKGTRKDGKCFNLDEILSIIKI